MYPFIRVTNLQHFAICVLALSVSWLIYISIYWYTEIFHTTEILFLHCLLMHCCPGPVTLSHKLISLTAWSQCSILPRNALRSRARNEMCVSLIRSVWHGAGAERNAGLVITFTRQDIVHVKCQTQSWAPGQGSGDMNCSSNHLCVSRIKLLLSLSGLNCCVQDLHSVMQYLSLQPSDLLVEAP